MDRRWAEKRGTRSGRWGGLRCHAGATASDGCTWSLGAGRAFQSCAPESQAFLPTRGPALGCGLPRAGALTLGRSLFLAKGNSGREQWSSADRCQPPAPQWLEKWTPQSPIVSPPGHPWGHLVPWLRITVSESSCSQGPWAPFPGEPTAQGTVDEVTCCSHIGGWSRGCDGRSLSPTPQTRDPLTCILHGGAMAGSQL